MTHDDSMTRSLSTGPIGNGLILRQATATDMEALVAFTADVLRHQDAPAPDAHTAAWTRDLMEGRHPHFNPDQLFFVVEEIQSGAIIASACLIPQTWRYGDVPIAVGQPELIGTRPDYRGRGLVRALFSAIHECAAARGLHLLAIDGVPYFYRQFGYEMALERHGGRVLNAARLPAGDRHDAYRVRAATEADVPSIGSTADQAAARYLLTSCRDDSSWRYELSGRQPMSFYRTELCVVVGADDRPVGFLAHASHTARLAGATLALYACELAAATSWESVTPSLLAYVRSTGAQYARAEGDDFRYVGLWLGTDHPLYAAIESLRPQVAPPYAWYLRVPNLPGFVRHVAPVLEQRLAGSAFEQHCGELRLSFYRGGLRLRFDDGRLVAVTAWQQANDLVGVERLQPTTAPRADAFFPGLTFLQVLFGYRSLDDLAYAFPDCLVRTDNTRALLTVLFPQRPSSVWPVV